VAKQVLQSELVSTQRALANEKRERQIENQVASKLAQSLEKLIGKRSQKSVLQTCSSKLVVKRQRQIENQVASKVV